MSSSRARPSLTEVTAFAFVVILATVGIWRWNQESEQERDALRGPPPAELSRFELIRNWVRRGAEAVPEVIKALGDEDPMIRRSAARALGQIGPEAKDAIPALRAGLADPHEDVRIDSASALVSVSGPTPEVVAEVSVLVSDESPMVRREIVKVLQNVGPPVAPLMIERLRGTDAGSRVFAFEVLRALVEPRTAGLTGSAGQMRSDASDSSRLPAETLQEIVDQFRQFAGDDESPIRVPARIVLANADLASIEELKLWLVDPTEDVSMAALIALDRLGPGAAPALPELVIFLQTRARNFREGPDSKDPLLLAQAIDVISRLDLAARSAIEPLMELLQEKRFPQNLRASLLKALPAIGAGRDQLVPLLVKYVHADDSALSKMASHILKGLDPSTMREQVPLICQGFKVKDPESPSAQRALEIVWCLGPVAELAVPDLIALLRSDKIRVQARAAWILSSIGPGAVDAVPEMLKLIERGERDDDLLEAIITAAGTIGPAASSLGPFVLQHAVKPSSEQSGDRLHRTAIRAGTRLGLRQPEYVAAVHAALKSKDVSENFAAMDALSAAGSPDRVARPDMLRHLECREPRLRLVAAYSIPEIAGPEPDVIAALARRLEDSSHDVRMAAAESLGRIGPPAAAALPALNRALADEESALPLLKLPDYSRVWIDSNLYPIPHRQLSLSFCMARVFEESRRKVAEEGG